MDAASTQRGESPEVRRDFSFNVHVGQSVSTKQVIEAFLALIPPASGRACHPYGGGRFTLTVKTADAAEKLREAGRLEINGKTYDLLPLASKVKHVTLLLLPVEVPDYAVAQVLGAYGKIIRMTRETHREYPSLETGTRRVTLEMERELPNYIQVCGFQGMCLYQGMKKACRRCGQGGHLSYDCRTPRCTRCGEYGHTGTECLAPCKRCGEGHPTSRCQVSTYASVLTGEAHETRREDEGEEEDNPGTGDDPEPGAMAEATGTSDDSGKQGGGAASVISPSDAAVSTEDAAGDSSVSAEGAPEGATTTSEKRSETSSGTTSSTLSSRESSEEAVSGKDGEALMDATSQSVKRPHPSSSRDSCDSDKHAHMLPGQLGKLPRAPTSTKLTTRKKAKEWDATPFVPKCE